MKKIILLLIVLLNVLILSSCGKERKEGEEESMNVVIELYDGRQIKIELYEDVAPISVKNFLKLVDQDYYKDVIFHRVIADFMIQAGGFKVVDGSLSQTPETKTIKGEFSSNGVENNLKHTAGVISMARTNINDSASSQFFICSADSPHLDGKYAAFGKVMDEESMKVVLSISLVQTGTIQIGYGNYLQNFPYDPVIIKTIKRLPNE